MTSKSDYIKIVDNIIDISNDIVEKEKLNEFKNYINNKLNNFKPTLMVYGTYNAGKSTLINALLGKKEAKTGDAPETSKIEEYDWNGYIIYDTPGINAPIEHEKITNEHLKKCEIILFVISNDGSFEEEYIYKKIIEIINMNKKLIIILNNKKGIELYSEEAIKEINKLDQNLLEIGKKENIENISEKIYATIIIDALLALDGKLEQDEELIKESNILLLEKYIENILKESDLGIVIENLNLYIKNFINEIILEINKQITNNKIKETEEFITNLEKLKNRSKIELENLIHKKMNLLEEGLETRFLNQDNIDNINNFIEKEILEPLSLQIENNIKEISNKIEINIDDFNKKIKIDPINIDFDKNEIEETSSLIIEEQVKTLLKNKELTQKVSKEVLLKLREWKIAFKGRWEKTLNKYAGRIATAINILVSIYEVYQTVKMHEEEKEAHRKHILNSKSKAKEIRNSVEDGLILDINNILNKLFDNLISSYRENLKELDLTTKTLLEKKEKLELIFNKI
jgi:GTP-binding protein EngB required for normal cell division